MARKIPTCMATQHPDNAGKPFWQRSSFISSAAEIRECFICYADLGITEYNWDWEGKFVDEAVTDRLIHEHSEYFRKNPLGHDKFLTFRIPNPRVERQFRLARAYMVIITASQLAQSLGFDHPPIFETILPLTESALEIVELQKAFRDLVSIEHRLLAMEDSIQLIEIIPLFEQVEKIINSADILRTYIGLHKKYFGFKPAYMRPYCARSDPALNSGLIPTMIALKIALSSYSDLEEESGVKLFPMLGTGTLPFRGGVNPDDIDSALEEYKGVATLTLQSAFRYDFKKSRVLSAIDKINRRLPEGKAIRLKPGQKMKLKEAIDFFESPYRSTIEQAAKIINGLSKQVAKRRERLQHVGLFGYSRGVGKVSLPRAIPFTASLYSIGIPPELIGTGRGLKKAKDKGKFEDLNYCYINLIKDLTTAGQFLNKDNLTKLAKRYSFWEDVMEDVLDIEKTFDIELGPVTNDQKEHYHLANTLLDRFMDGKNVTQLITLGGLLRKSLG